MTRILMISICLIFIALPIQAAPEDLKICATKVRRNTKKLFFTHRCNPNTLVRLKELKNLKQLKITSAIPLTPKTAKHIRGSTSLERLYLKGGNISDEVVAQIAGMKNLKYLRLHSSSITDGAFKAIATLENLEELSLVDSYKYNGSGFAELPKLKRLKKLHIERGKGITQKNMKLLAKSTQLRRIVGLKMEEETKAYLQEHLLDTKLPR